MEDLLSIERTQKLDLLAHLVTNLPDTLILRGDSGSGKSSLLKAAMQKGLNSNDVLLLNAELSLSFESIQYELLQFLNKKYQLDSRSIADVLIDYEKQGKKLVLIIDDAGFLLTGLINALVNYAKEHSALKLVFALTSDEILIKSQTDGLNNGCHYIDLLSLNYAQTSVFVQQLVAVGDTQYIEKDINSAFLQEIYTETVGNLGAIQTFLKKRKKGYFNSPATLILLISLVAVVSTVISSFLWKGAEERVFNIPTKNKKSALVKEPSKRNSVKPNAEKVSAAKQFEVTKKKLEKIKLITIPNVPIIKIPVVKLPQLNIPIVQPNDRAKEGLNKLKNELLVRQDINEVTKKIETEVVVQRKQSFPMEGVGVPASEKLSIIKGTDDRAWFLEQKSTAYTMQLMVLSSKPALLQEQKKLKKMGYITYFLLKESNNKQVYTLYYGVFESVNDANNKSVELPAAMQKAWLRKIASIKKKLN